MRYVIKNSLALFIQVLIVFYKRQFFHLLLFILLHLWVFLPFWSPIFWAFQSCRRYSTWFHFHWYYLLFHWLYFWFNCYAISPDSLSKMVCILSSFYIQDFLLPYFQLHECIYIIVYNAYWTAISNLCLASFSCLVHINRKFHDAHQNKVT